MLKKDKTKPFRRAADSADPTAEEMVMNCAISKLKADRTPIPDNRFTLPPEYGVDGGGSSDTTDEHEYNGHEYVDLGLPSGTLWATMNVGANSPTDYGLYFQWGDTQGYADASTKAFTWDDYKYGTSSNLTKYNATDGLTNLELSDDAAAANMGGDWHMPNRAQCLELFKETKNGFVTNAGAFTQYAWDNSNGYSSPTSTTATISGWDTAGYFFFKNSYTSVTDAISAEDYLFIPAAGYCVDGEVFDVGNNGSVWTSTLGSEEDIIYAWGFYLNINSEAGVDYGFFRYHGQSVRGVVGQMDEITDETTPGGGGNTGK